MITHTLQHEYIGVGDPWPFSFSYQGTLVMVGHPFIVHIAERKNDVGIDVWYLAPDEVDNYGDKA